MSRQIALLAINMCHQYDIHLPETFEKQHTSNTSHKNDNSHNTTKLLLNDDIFLRQHGVIHKFSGERTRKV